MLLIFNSCAIDLLAVSSFQDRVRNRQTVPSNRKETKDGRKTNRVAASCHTRAPRRVPANRDACHTGRSRRRYQDRSTGNGEGRIPEATLGYRTFTLPSAEGLELLEERRTEWGRALLVSTNTQLYEAVRIAKFLYNDDSFAGLWVGAAPTADFSPATPWAPANTHQNRERPCKIERVMRRLWTKQI